MKKYRLIEYKNGEDASVSIHDTFKELCSCLADTVNTPDYTFRIEEVEESIMDRVKTYEGACRVLKQEPIMKDLLYDYEEDHYGKPVWIPKFNEVSHIIALLKLETITAALNEGWKPDWEDAGQKKWLPTFTTTVIKGSTPTINADIAQWVNFPDGINPSRLYFKSRELAEYAAKQFAELYKQLLIEKF